MTYMHQTTARHAQLWLAVTLALASAVSHAQSRQTAPPDSGQLLQQVPRTPALAPSSNTGLSIEQPPSAQSSSSAAFPVRVISIVGNTLIPTATLHALVAPGEGMTLTLTQLNSLAARITAAYHAKGYPLDSAYIPAQTLSDGLVRIAVIEARYGEVSLQNNSTISSRPMRMTLAPLSSSAPVSQGALDRSLLLLSDIPGVIVGSVLRPGAAPGSSDLVVNATPAPRYSGTLGLDDYGNRFTNRPRLSGTLNVNSLLGQGDLLDVTAITSGADMSYGRVGYRYLLNGQGTTVGASVSALQYRLGNGLSVLHAHGTAQVQSVYVSQPFIRSVAGNLYGQLEYDHKRLNDNIDVTGIDSNRHTDSWTASLAGDHRDSTGVFNFNVSGTWGKLHFNNPISQFVDMLGPQTRGSYARYNLSLARLQQLSTSNSLYVGFTAQWSSRNLDTSEQFYLGGPDTVRGYDVGAITGSQGNLATIELRHELQLPLPGAWQVSAFADSGHIEAYKDTFAAGPNAARVTSAGLGMHWVGPQSWLVSATISTPVGAAPALLGPTSSTRLWVQVQKGF